MTGNDMSVKKNRLQEELLKEERQSAYIPFGEGERCVYCGYGIIDGEKAVRVSLTGDIIHRKCWNDYAEAYADELCESLCADGDMYDEF